MWFTIREGFKNLKINKLLSISTFSTMFTSLTLLGLFASIAFSLIVAFNSFEQQQSNILVFLDSEVDKTLLKNIEKNIKSINGVSKVDYISQEEALKKVSHDVKDSIVYEDIKENNPLPHAYMIEAKQGKSTDNIYKELVKYNKTINDKMDIKYEKEYILSIKETMQNLKFGLISMIALLVVVSLFLIMIVTNLTIHNKRQDLKIMWLTGAPIRFIKGPFFVSGGIIGLFSSILSAFTVFVVYNQYVEIAQQMIPFFSGINLYPNNWMIFISIILLGIILGLSGSIISTNKSIKNLIKNWN